MMERKHRRIRYQERARHQRQRLFSLVAVAFLLFGALGIFALADDGENAVTVTVTGGDTLWDICEQYVPERMDLRDFIAKVRYVNHLDSSEIFSGQELVIPLR